MRISAVLDDECGLAFVCDHCDAMLHDLPPEFLLLFDRGSLPLPLVLHIFCETINDGEWSDIELLTLTRKEHKRLKAALCCCTRPGMRAKNTNRRLTVVH